MAARPMQLRPSWGCTAFLMTRSRTWTRSRARQRCAWQRSMRPPCNQRRRTPAMMWHGPQPSQSSCTPSLPSLWQTLQLSSNTTCSCLQPHLHPLQPACQPQHGHRYTTWLGWPAKPATLCATEPSHAALAHPWPCLHAPPQEEANEKQAESSKTEDKGRSTKGRNTKAK